MPRPLGGCVCLDLLNMSNGKFTDSLKSIYQQVIFFTIKFGKVLMSPSTWPNPPPPLGLMSSINYLSSFPICIRVLRRSRGCSSNVEIVPLNDPLIIAVDTFCRHFQIIEK